MSDGFIGIDAGSSVVKAACFDREGRDIAVASRRTPLSRPQPGWVEASQEACWRATLEVLAEVVAASRQPREAFAAIGVTGAMVGA